jgi:chemotaxis signal transduction protein
MSIAALVLRIGDALCAIPLDGVNEVMRPRPLLPLPDRLPFTLGAALVRGEVVPVVDLAGVLEIEGAGPRRYVSVRGGHGPAVVAADDVLGVQWFDRNAYEALPPLLQPSSPDAPRRALAVRDRQLYLLLDTGRLLPTERTPA